MASFFDRLVQLLKQNQLGSQCGTRFIYQLQAIFYCISLFSSENHSVRRYDFNRIYFISIYSAIAAYLFCMLV